MNTHDKIELPPLPNINVGGKDCKQVWFSADEVDELRRAAIEADRKRRGEPVGYVMPTAIKQLKAGGNAIVGGVSQGGDVAVYLAPQPAEPVNVSEARKYAKQELLSATDKAYRLITNSEAPQRFEGIFGRDAEPVKVPSDSEIMWEWANTKNTGDMRIDLVAFARALLARYGQQAHTSVPEPLKYGREWKDHYVTGWNNCRAAMIAAEQAQQDNPTPEEEEAWQRMERRS